MRDEIEDLYSLADECREWAKALDFPLERRPEQTPPTPSACIAEFHVLAFKLDEIAKRLAARLPT